jgi:protein SCO1/2
VSTLQSKSLPARWVIALAVACGLALSQLPDQPRPPASQNSVLEWLPHPRPIAQFNLTSAGGDVTANSMRGHWQFLILGFTHCPDLCPTTLTQLTELRTVLAENQPRVIFVSIDPERDSPSQLAEYVQFFGSDIIGITGDEQQLHRLANSLGMDFRHDGTSAKPRISHSPTIALIGPEGFLRGRLRPGFDVQQAAREIAARLRTAS